MKRGEEERLFREGGREKGSGEGSKEEERRVWERGRVERMETRAGRKKGKIESNKGE